MLGTEVLSMYAVYRESKPKLLLKNNGLIYPLPISNFFLIIIITIMIIISPF
jgi:hypothetical protein